MMAQDPVKFMQIFKQCGDFDTDESVIKELAEKEGWDEERLKKAIGSAFQALTARALRHSL